MRGLWQSWFLLPPKLSLWLLWWSSWSKSLMCCIARLKVWYITFPYSSVWNPSILFPFHFVLGFLADSNVLLSNSGYINIYIWVFFVVYHRLKHFSGLKLWTVEFFVKNFWRFHYRKCDVTWIPIKRGNMSDSSFIGILETPLYIKESLLRWTISDRN